MRGQPFRDVGANVIRRSGKIGGDESIGKWRRRVPVLGELGVERGRRLAPFEDRDAEREMPGRVAAHPPCQRRALAQRVVDDVADRRAIAGSGEAVRQAPILQRFGGRPMANFKIGENFDRRSEPAGELHQPAARCMAITIHIAISERTPTRNA